MRPYTPKTRGHPLYWASVTHRVSGVLLAFFLPVHFYVLSLAVNEASAFDEFTAWAEAPLVKAAEIGLVLLLAVHLMGGLRVLSIEFLAWRNWQKNAAAISIGLSFLIGLAFMLNVV